MSRLVSILLAALVAASTAPPAIAGGTGQAGLIHPAQRRLARQGEVFYRSNGKRHIVVLPSLTLRSDTLAAIKGVTKYEDRSFWALLMLKDPRTRLSMLTSEKIAPAVVDYYINDLLGNRQARSRLTLYSANDNHMKPLTTKLLEDKPELLARLKLSLDADKDAVKFVWPFVTTDKEWKLADMLGIAVLGPGSGQTERFGTKTGSKRAFSLARIRQPRGRTGLKSVEQVVAAVDSLVTGYRRQIRRSVALSGSLRFRRAFARASNDPHTLGVPKNAMVKLEDGVSGNGNAVLDLRPLYSLSGKARTARIRELLGKMKFNDETTSWRKFAEEINSMGAIVEVFVPNEGSPSVQVMITAGGQVRVLSTHGQLFADKDQQVYAGCHTIADAPYLKELHLAGERVGKVLAKRGVRGRFAIDFVVGRDQRGRWQANAVEINLRSGGTTHPYEIARLLTDSSYDNKHGVLTKTTAAGKVRQVHYFASDNFIDKAFLGMSPAQIIALAKRSGLHYDRKTETGVALHMIQTVTSVGKIGFTAIGETAAQAKQLYQDFQRQMIELAKAR
ncbi:MAG: hypothetical protein H6707_17875 [Deltaproteobacteria bacterium]|nr:hypothetical protein [Deltaproteobacteria bacterium]